VSSALRLSRRLVAGESGAASWAPRTRFNAPVSGDRVFDARTFDLGRICEIKKSVAGATVNDVVLSVCGGALRKYLEAKGELPDASLVAMAPISIRSPSEEGAGGNRLSQMAVALRSDVADAAERLRLVAQGTARSKDTTTAGGAQLLADCAELVPGSLLRLALGATTKLGLTSRLNRLCNTVITNIRGPAVPIYSTGARLRAMYGFGPIVDGMGLIQTVFSYDGSLTLSFTSCREMLPDPAFYGACLDDAFRELEDAVFGGAPRSPTSRSGTA
jgi:WS/DGAT/MGAT family acyltransferase